MGDASFEGWALSDGDVYVAPSRRTNDQDTTFALDLLRVNGKDGTILWNVSFGLADVLWEPRRPISGCNGEVYVYALGFSGYNFHAFDSSGDPLRYWICPTNGPRGQAVIHSKRQMEDGTGEDVFTTNMPRVPGGKQVSDWTDVIAYSGTTGHFLWNASLAGMYFVHDSFGPDGTVFARDYGQTSVAIRDGDEVWRTRDFHAVLMAEDGTTYLQYHDYVGHMQYHDSVVALDMNGMQKWTYPIMDPTVDPALAQSFS